MTKLRNATARVKAISGVRLSRELPPVCEDILQEAIHRSLIGPTALLTVSEFARKINRTETTVYHYADGQKSIPANIFATLLRETVAAGDLRLIGLVLPPSVILQSNDKAILNGSITDEVSEITKHLGAAIDRFEKGDTRGARISAFNASQFVNQLSLEIDAKK